MNFGQYVPQSAAVAAAAKWWEALDGKGKGEAAWRVMRMMLAVDAMHRALRRDDRGDHAAMYADEVVARYEFLRETYGVQGVEQWVKWLKGQLGWGEAVFAARGYSTARGVLGARVKRG